MDELEFNDSMSDSPHVLLVALKEVQEARKNLYNRHGFLTPTIAMNLYNSSFNVDNAELVVKDSFHNRELGHVEKFFEHLRTINLDQHNKVAKLLAKPLHNDIAKLHESLKGNRCPIEDLVTGWMDYQLTQ